ncbi:MAG TPA: hypothetical protein VM010_06870 [Chitinophagaceae bacterium]|nr:hypothetical protein [Chitinophagaceae bacterium]
MSLTLRTTFGCTEAVLDDDGSLKRFYQVADLLKELFGIQFINKEDDFDAINWDFFLARHRLTLHYSIYNGISIFPTKTKDARRGENNIVAELASVLQEKLRLTDLQQQVA